MNPDQRHGAPENAANAETLEAMSAALNARPWAEVRSGIPAWHPRMDEDGTPPADADVAPADPAEQQEDQAPELPFKLDDITDDFTLTGEEARKWLLGRQAQLQAPVTRRQQELAQQAERLAVYDELEKQLNDPNTSVEAVVAFAKRAGIELDVGEDEVEDDDATEYTDPLEKEVAELRAWREQQEADAATAQESAAAAAAEQQFEQHAISEMERIAQSMGTTLEEMPAEDKQDIVARALTSPTLANGLPDFDAGLAAHVAYKEYVSKLEAEKYAASKTGGMNPGVNGGSGSSVVDLRDTNQRLARAMAAADKHYSTT